MSQKNRIILGDCRAILKTLPSASFDCVVTDPPYAAVDRSYGRLSERDWPKLPDAIEVMRAWRFQYVTGFPWIKYTPSVGDLYTGIGFWVQGCSEMLLIGRRGKAKKVKGDPRLGLLSGDDRQFYAPRSRHSQKPLEIHEWATRMLPGPHCELFARRQYPGWQCYGYDTDYEQGPYGVRPIEATA